MKENVRCAFEIVRMAVCAQRSRWTTAKHRSVFKVPIHVTHYKQIETTIAIVVEPAGASGPPTVDFGKLARDVAESTVAIVVIQAIGDRKSTRLNSSHRT